jgi:alcohol dehydrogenase
MSRDTEEARMRAVTWSAYGELPTLAELPTPACPDDGVVVRVGATGVCRSDWHAWLGHDPVPFLPWVPGHELAGTVEQVGPAVTRWQPGDRVTVPFACGCGRCEQCAAGDTQVCALQTQPGFTHHGSFAELVALHAADTNLVRLPDALSFVDAASLGCRFATAYRAVVHQGRTEAGDWLAVHGCGGVGLSAVMVGVALGARVVAVDVSQAARATARGLGAAAGIDATGLTPEQIGEAVRDATGGGAQVSVDALGGTATMTASLASLRRRGRHVQVGLMLGDSAVAPVPMGRAIAEELEILGSHGMPATDYPGMLALVASRRLDVRRLVGRIIPLDDAPEALAGMSEPATSAGMTVVDLAL